MFQEKVNEIIKDIEELEPYILELKYQLREINEDTARYELLWKLKEDCEKTKDLYRSLEIWSDEDQSDKYHYYSQQEIYYFETCLKMLKDKHGASKIDLRHFLNVANLEYLYFIIKDKSLPDDFINSSFELEGFFADRRINLIVNNIFNAQKNLRILLEYYNNERKHKELFIYYELMGDLYIHIFCYIIQNKINLDDLIQEYLKNALFFYELSIWHKTQLEFLDPTTYFEGLHGWPSQGLFHSFYNEIGVTNVHNVREKKENIENKYLLTQNEKEGIQLKVKRAINEFQ